MSLSYTNRFICKKNCKKKGSGILNTLINKLPFELHLPGYNFCGPGTKLQKRLSRGDRGVNPLDEACKQHDIEYSASKDIKSRHVADSLLAQKALDRLKAKDSSLGEKAAAFGISSAMKLKTKLGMGMKRRKRKIIKRKGKGISLARAISLAKKRLQGKKIKSVSGGAKLALASLNKCGKILPPKKRIIPIPKTGGLLPLIPLFAGLSALGALGGGAAGIAKAVNDAKAAKDKIEENKRHNKTMEAIALGTKGSGLYLKPFLNHIQKTVRKSSFSKTTLPI